MGVHDLPSVGGGGGGGTGAQGPAGPAGPAGPPGASSSAYLYSLSTSSVAPPNSGEIRSDGATAATSTVIYAHYKQAGGGDVAPLLRTIAAGDLLTTQDRGDSALFAEFEASADVIDHPAQSYVEIPVLFISATAQGKNNQAITLFHQMPGAEGPAGPKGDKGDTGAATLIVGEFITRTAADLPPSGLIPAGWDGAGTFPGGKQMTIGQSLIYNPADVQTPGAGRLWQYVSTSSDPSGWVDIGLVRGPTGAGGAQGQTGPRGPQGIAGKDGVDGAAGAAGLPGGAIRKTATATVTGLANAAQRRISISLAPSYLVTAIETSVPARVRLYPSNAAATADLNRPVDVEPDASSELALEYVTEAAKLSSTISPLVGGAQVPPTPTVQMAVGNLSGATSDVSVTLTYLALEA